MMYKVIAESWGGAKHDIVELMTYEEAVEFCESNDWVLCMDGGYVWDLIIDEMQ